MTTEAESADVVEVALAASFRNRQNVVGVPETFARARLETPVGEQGTSLRAARIAKLPCGGDAINTAGRANALVTLEYPFPQVRGLGAQLPLVHTVFRTERKAAPWNFQGTPAAQSTVVGSARDRLAIDPASLDCAHSAHCLFLNALHELRDLLLSKVTKKCTGSPTLRNRSDTLTRMAAYIEDSASHAGRNVALGVNQNWFHH